MKRLFYTADEYVKQSDWKNLALVKFCLCAVGVIIGILIPATKKKPVGIAAAATISYMIAGCAPMVSPTVELNRPFVFAIVHDDTKLPIFTGVVNSIKK